MYAKIKKRSFLGYYLSHKVYPKGHVKLYCWKKIYPELLMGRLDRARTRPEPENASPNLKVI